MVLCHSNYKDNKKASLLTIYAHGLQFCGPQSCGLKTFKSVTVLWIVGAAVIELLLIQSILLFRWYHSSYASLRILNIPYVTRYEMHVNMENALTRSRAHINPDIIAIRMITLINLLLHILQHHIHRLALMIREVKVRSYVAFGDD